MWGTSMGYEGRGMDREDTCVSVRLFEVLWMDGGVY